MNEKKYRSIPALSGSAVRHLLNSPAHYKAEMETRNETAAMKLGTAAHKLILEGDEAFLSEYKALGCCQARKAPKKKDEVGDPCTNPAKWITPLGVQLCGVHKRDDCTDEGVLTREDFDACFEMRNAVIHHSRARSLMTCPGISELPLIYEDGEVAFKGKIDRLPADGSFLIDLKTTNDALCWAPDDAALQAAHYIRLCKLKGHERITGAIFVVVENQKPYSVRCIQLDDRAIAVVNDCLERMWALYAKCTLSGEWPGLNLGDDGLEVCGLRNWTEKAFLG